MPFFGQFVQEDNEHALKITLFPTKKQSQERQRQKQEPKPGDFGASESENKQFKSAQCPKHNLGLKRPSGSESAAKHLFADCAFLGDSGDLQIAPAAAIDFD